MSKTILHIHTETEYTQYLISSSMSSCSANRALPSGGPQRAKKHKPGSCRIWLYFSYPTNNSQSTEDAILSLHNTLLQMLWNNVNKTRSKPPLFYRKTH